MKAWQIRNDSSSESDSEDEETQQKYKQGVGKYAKKSNMIIPRPNASAGYWLCCLLPLALGTRYLHLVQDDAGATDCTKELATTHKMLTVAAFGMCVESLCFFTYIYVDSWLLLKLMISLLPSLLTSVLFKYIVAQSWGSSMLWGFGVTFCYQNVYVRVMRGLPKCFSYGEAAILIEGLMLFVLNVVLQVPRIIFADETDALENDFAQLNVIMMSALFLLLVACVLLVTFRFLREPWGFYPLMLLLVLGVTVAPVTTPLPVIALFNFLFKNSNRLIFILYFVALTFLTIATVWWQLRHAQKASTRVRKIFHALIVLVYVPGLLYQCSFLYIATGVALAIFTVLELFRILQIPPLASVLKDAFASFSDEKDAGILALTPFSLLIGCSLPIWLHPCPCHNSGMAYIPLLAGVLSIGVGDAAASVFGSKYGRTRWRNSHRSLEGSVAYIISILLTTFCLSTFNFIHITSIERLMTIVATLVTALMEAHTDQIDNLVLPLVFYTIVSLV